MVGRQTTRIPIGTVRHAVKELQPDPNGVLRDVVTGLEEVEVEAEVDGAELLVAYGQRVAGDRSGFVRIAGDGLVLRVVRRQPLP